MELRHVLARVPASHVQAVHVARHQVSHVSGSLQRHERHVREAGARAVELARRLGYRLAVALQRPDPRRQCRTQTLFIDDSILSGGGRLRLSIGPHSATALPSTVSSSTDVSLRYASEITQVVSLTNSCSASSEKYRWTAAALPLGPRKSGMPVEVLMPAPCPRAAPHSRPLSD